MMALPQDENADRLARFYQGSSAYRDHLASKSPRQFERYVAQVRRFVPPGARALEVGCGTGQAARMLADAGYRVIGSDLSALFLRAAREARVPAPLVAADAMRLPFGDESFDAVCALEWIEHMPYVAAALSELRRVVRVGGFVILRSPALASPVWPILDLPNLLLRRGGRPPHYGNLREAARFFAANLKRSLRAALKREPAFEPRLPTLSDAHIGGDGDASYWSSGAEVARHLVQHGFRVLQRADAGAPLSPAWLVDRIAPWLSPTIAIVAKRER
ncbi:MAG: class I SAM-dependent methyltransferase [Candidatus Sumerlaeota bacterium]|nr:class I SAM-dependent methyltransferase [Candidatus Sumerlaeota bacterium]